MDTKIEDVLREMQEAVHIGRGVDPMSVDIWMLTIEQAMREPVAEVDLPGACDPRRGVLMSREDQIRLMKMGQGTKLFTFQPDAAGEIAVLRDRLHGREVLIDKQQAEIERLKAENERLRALVEFEPDLEAALAEKEKQC